MTFGTPLTAGDSSLSESGILAVAGNQGRITGFSGSPLTLVKRRSAASRIPCIVASREVSGVKNPKIIAFFVLASTTVAASGPFQRGIESGF
jgi:hypothetical protein